MRNKKQKRAYQIFFVALIGLFIFCQGCGMEDDSAAATEEKGQAGSAQIYSLQTNVHNVAVHNGKTGELSGDMLLALPDFTGEPYVILNNNVPGFTDEERESKEPFEQYSELDALGRCQRAYANICQELMPEEERGTIGQIKPSGWQLVKYDIVDGKYLYNRCHLIGYQLAGENANEKNLITGTRYLNITGMLPFENMVADYVKQTNHHVLYRVTPIYDGDNLVAKGVQMEAYSVEDEGAGICFHVFVYNSQPGIEIDYATGENWILEDISATEEGTENDEAFSISKKETENTTENSEGEHIYIINRNTGKFHLPTCDSVNDMKESNKIEVSCDREEIISDGYAPCKRCNP